MSVEALKWAYQQRAGNGPAKAVLVSLAEQAHHGDHSCYPGQETIAERTEFSVRTVRTALADLEKLGLITRSSRYGGPNRRTSDFYTLAVTQADAATASPPPLPAPAAGSNGATTGKSSTVERVLPANNVATTGRSCRVTVREPSVVKNEPSRARARAARGTRISEDWQPSPELLAWAAGEGVDSERCRRWTDSFRDYWLAKAGRDACKLRWDLTWRKWIRTEADRAGCQPPSATPKRQDRTLDALNMPGAEEAFPWMFPDQPQPRSHA